MVVSDLLVENPLFNLVTRLLEFDLVLNNSIEPITDVAVMTKLPIPNILVDELCLVFFFLLLIRLGVPLLVILTTLRQMPEPIARKTFVFLCSLAFEAAIFTMIFPVANCTEMGIQSIFRFLLMIVERLPDFALDVDKLLLACFKSLDLFSAAFYSDAIDSLFELSTVSF